jgi:hypothetical protein
MEARIIREAIIKAEYGQNRMLRRTGGDRGGSKPEDLKVRKCRPLFLESGH